MKILVIAVGSRGDVNPFLVLALKLMRKGHEVVFCASENFRQLIEGQGLRFIPHFTLQEYEEVAQDPDLWHYRKALPTYIKKGLLPLMRQTLSRYYAGAHEKFSGYCPPVCPGCKACRGGIGDKSGAAASCAEHV